MPGFTKGLRSAGAALFGNGSLGDVTISSIVQMPTNGTNVLTLNYNNLTVLNMSSVLTAAAACRALIVKVRGVLTLNGYISMNAKGCYIPGVSSNFHFGYSDIFVPLQGAAGGIGRADTGLNGANGVNGQCGGGGAGGGSGSGQTHSTLGGNGGSGYVFGGGTGGSGATLSATDQGWRNTPGKPGAPYGQKGGDGVVSNNSYNPGDDNWQIAKARSGGGAGVVPGAGGAGDAELTSGSPGGTGVGGILIVMANRIEGSGVLTSRGANGGVGQSRGYAGACGSGGSGGGSITVFYGTSGFTGQAVTLGGAGSAGVGPHATGKNGGNGGSGSVRWYSLAELASHTRL